MDISFWNEQRRSFTAEVIDHARQAVRDGELEDDEREIIIEMNNLSDWLESDDRAYADETEDDIEIDW
jgi:hypothetical protein